MLDASGNGRHGTPARDLSATTAAGKIDKGYNANGTSDFVDCGARLLGSGSFSLAGWVCLDSLDLRPLVGQLGNSVGDFLFRVSKDANGRMRLLRWTGAGGTYQFWNTNTLAVGAGVWTHVAVTFNAASSEVVFYVNGTAETALPPATSVSTQTAANTRIGRGTSDYLDGIIDDLRLYSEVLTAAQIAAIYNGANGTGAAYPWLVAAVKAHHYRMRRA